jgi:hypothetical protein
MSARLWEKMDGDRIWLENPRRKRRRKGGGKRRRGGRFKKGSAAAKRYMASIRPNRGTKRRRKRARRNAGVSPAWLLNGKRKGSHMARRKRHGRRRYRRNPGGRSGFSVKGILGRLQRGVVDGLWVVAGEAGAGIVPGFFPAIPSTGVVGFVVQGLTAVGLGEVVRRFAKNSRAAEFVVAGALAKPIRALALASGIPQLTRALSSYPSFAAYPEAGNVVTGGALSGVPGGFVESGDAETQGIF